MSEIGSTLDRQLDLEEVSARLLGQGARAHTARWAHSPAHKSCLSMAQFASHVRLEAYSAKQGNCQEKVSVLPAAQVRHLEVFLVDLALVDAGATGYP